MVDLFILVCRGKVTHASRDRLCGRVQVCPKRTHPRRETLEVLCETSGAFGNATASDLGVSRAVALNQNVTRAILPAARAPSDLAHEMDQGNRQIWQEENTDDEDSSEERAFPCHTWPHVSRPNKISAGLSPDDLKKHLCVLEELSVRDVRSIVKWADSHDLARRARRHRPRTLLLYDRLFFGTRAGRRAVDGGIDVSGPSFSSHWHAWHPAGSGLSEGVPESSSWKIETKHTLFTHMGWE